MWSAVYCRFLISLVLPAAIDWQAWVTTAPAWAGYEGELDASGRLQHKFGPHAGKLTIRYDYLTRRGTVAGSLQVWAKGSNVAPFPWSEVLAACQDLADTLQLPANLLKVHVLETGATIVTTDAPTAFLAQLSRAHYGPLQRPFYATEPPKKCAYPLQYVACTNELRVKVYDKGAFARLKNQPLPFGPSGQGFRFELHYLKARRLGAALGWEGALTLTNLMQPDVYEKLAARLLESWHHIHFPAPMDSPNLTIDQRALLIAGQYPEFWEASKRETPPATLKRKRALFRQLQQAQAAQGTATTPYTADVEQHIKESLPVSEMSPFPRLSDAA